MQERQSNLNVENDQQIMVCNIILIVGGVGCTHLGLSEIKTCPSVTSHIYHSGNVNMPINITPL